MNFITPFKAEATVTSEIIPRKKIENDLKISEKITFVTGVSFKVEVVTLEVTGLVDFTWKIFDIFEDEVNDEKKVEADLIFVIFSPLMQFLDKFFSTQKCVNHDKTDFETILRKLQKKIL